MLYVLSILIAAVVAIIIVRRALWSDLRAEFQEAVDDLKTDVRRTIRKAEADAHQREWERRNPAGEPIGPDEAEAFVADYRALARPALLLRADPEADALSAAARLGGPVWLADDEGWPTNAAGDALEFIAQLDFARLPALEGFPARGVARFFVGRDDLWGANFDEPDRSDVLVLWHDGSQDGGRYEPPVASGRPDYSPFQHAHVRERGLALRPEPAEDLPDFQSWQLQERLDGHARRPGFTAVEDRLFALSETRAFAHRVGGHPTFTQYDFRKRGVHDDLDVVLLGLSSDEAIMWGDAGEAVFLMRAADLERRDFSRVAFYWDCH